MVILLAIIFGIIILSLLTIFIIINSKPHPKGGGGGSKGGGGSPKGGGTDENCAGIGVDDNSKKCCTGLAKNWDGSCSKFFDCTQSTQNMLAKDSCLNYNSGQKCINDTKCVAMGIGPAIPQQFICVNKKYSYGLGIGINDSYNCYTKLANAFAFPGGTDGCTTDGDRDVPEPNTPVTNCCTLNVDNCPNT